MKGLTVGKKQVVTVGFEVFRQSVQTTSDDLEDSRTHLLTLLRSIRPEEQ
jgi:hypothetical protein